MGASETYFQSPYLLSLDGVEGCVAAAIWFPLMENGTSGQIFETRSAEAHLLYDFDTFS
jgi:hypothetical protein